MNKKGYTLIEILAVISIIIIIIGMGIPAYNSFKERSKIAETESTIAKIEMAMEMYKTDNGSYPQKTASNDLNADGLIKRYFIDPQRPYMKFKGRYDAGNGLLDPWGNPYKVFTAQGSTGDADFRHNTNSYYIYSYGPDKRNDTNDDIDNYKLP